LFYLSPASNGVAFLAVPDMMEGEDFRIDRQPNA
jgi:hypothetical protein